MVAERRRTRSNGEGGVYKYQNVRSDGVSVERWRGTATVAYIDGKQVRKTVTGKTKTEVLDKLRKVQNAAEHGIDLPRADLTVGKFLSEWMTDVLPGTVRASTLQQYQDVVKLYIVPVLGQKRLRTLSSRDVSAMQQFLAHEYARKNGKDDAAIKGLAPHTQRIARSVLRRALRWAEQEGKVARNVASIAQGVKIDAGEGRTLTPEQARAFLAAAEKHRLAAAFTVALALGLRLGELLALSWSDIELDATRPRLTVHRALKRLAGRGLVLEDAKTRTSRRTVYLPTSATAALKAHRDRQTTEQHQAGAWEPLPLGVDLVFRTEFGTAVDPANFRHYTYKVTQDAGLGRWSPHELRHSAASLLLSQGVPLKVVSETLGHSSIRITADVYGHLLEPAREEAAEAMERALFL